MKEYDVIIVGGGPAGGFIAGRLAEKKYSIAVFEKNKEIGIPMNCAGLVTPRVFNLLNLSKKNIVQNEIKGANVHSPSGKTLTIGGDRIHAFAINRTNFDKEIMNFSCKKGANLYLNNKVETIKKNDNFIEIKTSKNVTARCKILIGADGPNSLIRNSYAFPEPKEFLYGMGAEITNSTLDPNYAEIFIGNNVAPGFFAWIIPTNREGTTARVGLCISSKTNNTPIFYFDKFLNSSYSRSFLKNSAISKKIGGIIPLGFLKKIYDSNVMIVGDAAAQVKPTSGGGIYPGLLCAINCSNVAIQALKNNDFSAQMLKKYQRLCTREIGNELYFGMKLRTIFKNLTDKRLDKFIDRFNDPKIIEVINKFGDIDYPSKLAKQLIKKSPTLLKLIPKLIKK